MENGTTNAYSLGIGNRLSTFGSSGATLHDSAGNITNVTYNDGRELDITWNQRYQVTSISTNGEVAQAFQYDALNRRVSVSDGSTTNFFIYDGLQVIAEADASGTLQKSYTWGPGIDNLLAFTTYTGGETNTYYALTDHLGSVHALVDETGAIVESYKYDAWGRVLGVYDGDGTPLEESAVGNNVLWQGREYSWATGLYYFRARWYDPVTGRWLSKDPIGISGGLNQYVACANNPVMYTDPLGLLFQPGDFLGIGGPVDRFLTRLTGIDEVTYGIERTIRVNRGMPDPGPIVGRDRGVGLGRYYIMGAEIGLLETTVLRPDGRYRYGILSVRSGFGFGASLGPSMPSFSSEYSDDPCSEPSDVSESWRGGVSGHALYGGSAGLEWDDFFWGSPTPYFGDEWGLNVDVGATATYGTDTVIYRRYLGPR